MKIWYRPFLGRLLNLHSPSAHLSVENPCWCQRLKPLHLAPFVTECGFLHMPSTEGSYPGSSVVVYESSAASGAFIWIRVKDNQRDASTHLALEAAGQLRDQLTYLIENHYQVKPR